MVHTITLKRSRPNIYTFFYRIQEVAEDEEENSTSQLPFLLDSAQSIHQTYEEIIVPHITIITIVQGMRTFIVPIVYIISSFYPLNIITRVKNSIHLKITSGVVVLTTTMFIILWDNIRITIINKSPILILIKTIIDIKKLIFIMLIAHIATSGLFTNVVSMIFECYEWHCSL